MSSSAWITIHMLNISDVISTVIDSAAVQEVQSGSVNPSHHLTTWTNIASDQDLRPGLWEAEMGVNPSETAVF